MHVHVHVYVIVRHPGSEEGCRLPCFQPVLALLQLFKFYLGSVKIFNDILLKRALSDSTQYEADKTSSHPAHGAQWCGGGTDSGMGTAVTHATQTQKLWAV